jgi:outer membrane biosynthesis protein TonB
VDNRSAALRAALRSLAVDRFNAVGQFLYAFARVDERRSASPTGTPLPEKIAQPAAAPPPSTTTAPAAPPSQSTPPQTPAPQAAPTPAPKPAPRPQLQPPQPPPKKFRSSG